MPLLTQEQLAKLRQIIQDASNALAISTFGYELPDEEIERLVAEGWIDLRTVENLTDGSYQIGVLHAEGGPADETLAEAQRKLKAAPVQLSEIERRAMGIASSRAGEYCVGLGNRWSANLGRIAVDADQQLARETRQAIREQTSQAVVERKTYQQLASDLRGLTEDWGRDWDRIAATELQAAHQEGFFEATIERYGDDAQMARVPDPGACPICIRLLTGADGKPIVHPMEWWLDNGSTNAGRKQNDWKPVYGPIHPHCRCTSIHVPAGMEIQADGSLEPEETEKSQTDDLTKAEPGDKEYVPSALEGHREFRKPKLKWRGLTIRLENEEGDIRGWFDPNAQRSGYSLMTVPYGYIENTEGEDGDEVDVFMGPMPSAKYVFVINQQKAPDFTEHDEQKCMVGFGTRALAVKAYLQHYDDPRFLGSVTPMKAEDFIKKVKKSNGKLIKAEFSSGPLRGTGYSGPGTIGRVVSGAAKVDDPKSAAKHAIDATAIMEMIEEAAKNNKRRARLVIDLHRFHKLETSLFETATPPHPRPKEFAEHLISPNDHPELESNRRHTELAGKRAVEGQNAIRQMKWSQVLK